MYDRLYFRPFTPKNRLQTAAAAAAAAVLNSSSHEIICMIYQVY